MGAGDIPVFSQILGREQAALSGFMGGEKAHRPIYAKLCNGFAQVPA